jgi:hypothetical protein
MPQELGVPLHESDGAESPPLDAKTENFLVNFFEPHFGHSVPAQRLERTSISLSPAQSSQ